MKTKTRIIELAFSVSATHGVCERLCGKTMGSDGRNLAMTGQNFC